ncbi:hypothetical protein GGF37_002341, partial [Kickxella alabastrina]
QTKDGEKVLSGRQKRNNRNIAAVLNFRIILNALPMGKRFPHFLRKKAQFELAKPKSTMIPEILPETLPNPKSKSKLLFARNSAMINIVKHSGIFIASSF